MAGAVAMRQFIFFGQNGKPLFVRDDAEQASWTVEQLAMTANFPYREDKVIERGCRVGFEDELNVLQPFEVRKVEILEPDHYQRITCEHIVISELTDCHMEAQELNNVTAQAALAGILTGTGWSVGNVTASGTSSGDLAIGSVWQNVRVIEENWNVYIVPRVTFNNSGITGKYLDIIPAGGTWRGILLTLDRNADEMGVVIDDTEVKTALFGYGGTPEGADDPLTFANVTWSATSQHPAKPQGQKYIEDPAATAAYGRNGVARFGFYQNTDITDPNVLLQKTWETLQTTNAPRVTVNCMVRDLYRLGYNDQPIRLHDLARVHIKDTNTHLELEIIQLMVDLLDPTATRPVIGAFIPNIVYLQRQTAMNASGGAANSVSGRRGGGGGGGRTALEEKLKQFETDILWNDYQISLRAYERDMQDASGKLLKAYAAIGISSQNIDAIVTGSGVRFDEDGNIITDENGNPVFEPGANPMYTKLNQTAEEVSSVATKSGVNSLGQGETLYSKISQTAEAITSEVTRATNAESSMSSRITQTASEISSEVTNRQNADNQLSSRITQNATQIALKVSAGDVATQLSVECGNVTISGGNLVVDGYVTASGLAATTVRVGGLVASADIDAQGVRADSIMLGNANVANAVASFGQTTSSGGRINIPYTTLGGGTGTITFNIADTQFYRDGVAAARPHSLSSVTLSSSDTGSVSKAITVFCADDEEYDLTTTINASAVYTAGKNTMGVTADAETQAVKAAQSSTKSLTISCSTPTLSYNTSTHRYLASATASAGSTSMHTASATSGTEAYDAGVTKGHSDRNIKASAFTVGNITEYPSSSLIMFNITATADDGTTYTSAYQSISYSGGGTYTLVNYARKNLTSYGYVQMYVYERNTYYSAGTHYWYWSSSGGWDTLYEQS